MDKIDSFCRFNCPNAKDLLNCLTIFCPNWILCRCHNHLFFVAKTIMIMIILRPEIQFSVKNQISHKVLSVKRQGEVWMQLRKFVLIQFSSVYYNFLLLLQVKLRYIKSPKARRYYPVLNSQSYLYFYIFIFYLFLKAFH